MSYRIAVNAGAVNSNCHLRQLPGRGAPRSPPPVGDRNPVLIVIIALIAGLLLLRRRASGRPPPPRAPQPPRPARGPNRTYPRARRCGSKRPFPRPERQSRPPGCRVERRGIRFGRAAAFVPGEWIPVRSEAAPSRRRAASSGYVFSAQRKPPEIWVPTVQGREFRDGLSTLTRGRIDRIAVMIPVRSVQLPFPSAVGAQHLPPGGVRLRLHGGGGTFRRWARSACHWPWPAACVLDLRSEQRTIVHTALTVGALPRPSGDCARPVPGLPSGTP